MKSSGSAYGLYAIGSNGMGLLGMVAGRGVRSVCVCTNRPARPSGARELRRSGRRRAPSVARSTRRLGNHSCADGSPGPPDAGRRGGRRRGGPWLRGRRRRWSAGAAASAPRAGRRSRRPRRPAEPRRPSSRAALRAPNATTSLAQTITVGGGPPARGAAGRRAARWRSRTGRGGVARGDVRRRRRGCRAARVSRCSAVLVLRGPKTAPTRRCPRARTARPARACRSRVDLDGVGLDRGGGPVEVDEREAAVAQPDGQHRVGGGGAEQHAVEGVREQPVGDAAVSEASVCSTSW